MIKGKTKTVDSYIEGYPKNVQRLLKQMRQTIRKAAPKAEETISYGIPTFRLKGNLVHFGAFTRHIGFFPTSSGVKAFRKELTPYKISAGTIQFPLDKPLPLNLVERIVRFRVRESSSKPNS